MPRAAKNPGVGRGKGGGRPTNPQSLQNGVVRTGVISKLDTFFTPRATPKAGPGANASANEPGATSSSGLGALTPIGIQLPRASETTSSTATVDSSGLNTSSTASPPPSSSATVHPLDELHALQMVAAAHRFALHHAGGEGNCQPYALRDALNIQLVPPRAANLDVTDVRSKCANAINDPELWGRFWQSSSDQDGAPGLITDLRDELENWASLQSCNSLEDYIQKMHGDREWCDGGMLIGAMLAFNVSIDLLMADGIQHLYVPESFGDEYQGTATITIAMLADLHYYSTRRLPDPAASSAIPPIAADSPVSAVPGDGGAMPAAEDKAHRNSSVATTVPSSTAAANTTALSTSIATSTVSIADGVGGGSGGNGGGEGSRTPPLSTSAGKKPRSPTQGTPSARAESSGRARKDSRLAAPLQDYSGDARTTQQCFIDGGAHGKPECALAAARNVEQRDLTRDELAECCNTGDITFPIWHRFLSRLTEPGEYILETHKAVAMRMLPDLLGELLTSTRMGTMVLSVPGTQHSHVIAFHGDASNRVLIFDNDRRILHGRPKQHALVIEDVRDGTIIRLSMLLNSRTPTVHLIAAIDAGAYLYDSVDCRLGTVDDNLRLWADLKDVRRAAREHLGEVQTDVDIVSSSSASSREGAPLEASPPPSPMRSPSPMNDTDLDTEGERRLSAEPFQPPAMHDSERADPMDAEPSWVATWLSVLPPSAPSGVEAAGNQAASDQPLAEQSVAEQPAADQPVAEQPAAKWGITWTDAALSGTHIPSGLGRIGGRGKDGKGDRRSLTFPKPGTDTHRRWKTVLPWLRYDASRNLMFCDLCVKRHVEVANFSSNNFVKGCSNFQISVLRTHRERCHERVTTNVSFNDFNDERHDDVVRLETALETHTKQLAILVATAYWLAWQKIALAKFAALCQLLDFVSGPLIQSYRTHVAAQEFVLSLVCVLREGWLAEARESHVLGLMIDESTDVSTTGQLILYLRYETRAHTFVTVLWKLLEVHDSTAKGLLAAVERAFDDDDIDIQRVFSLATDGCNAMLGDRGGFQQLFIRKHNAFCLSAHCIAHKNALAVSNAVKGDSFCETFEANFGKVISYHSRSSHRKSHLHECLDAVGLPTLELLRIHLIRWLSRGAALMRLCKLYAGVVKEMDDDRADKKNEKAQELYELLCSHAFVTTLCGMTDIIYRMHVLARLFQSVHVSYEEVSDLVTATINGLETDYRGGDQIVGPRWNELRRAVHTHSATLMYKYDGVSIRFDPSADQRVRKELVAFAKRIVVNLKARFPDNRVMASLAIFNVESKIWPTEQRWESEAATFGDNELDILLRRFGRAAGSAGAGLPSFAAYVDEHECRQEWKLLKHYMHLKRTEGWSQIDILQQLLSSRNTQFAAILPLVRLGGILCLSTVPCERGFSLLTLIKTDRRNKLRTHTLSALMELGAQGPPFPSLQQPSDAVSELVQRALEHWKRAKKRNVRKSHLGRAGRKKKPHSRQSAESLGPYAVPVNSDEDDSSDDDLNPYMAAQQRRREEASADVLHEQTSAGAEDAEPSGESEVATVLRRLAAIAPLSLDSDSRWRDWVVLPSEEILWEAPLQEWRWTNRRVAHKWDTGWDFATFHGLRSDAEGGGYWLYYQSVARTWAHELPRELYGSDNVWVVIAKEGT